MTEEPGDLFETSTTDYWAVGVKEARSRNADWSRSLLKDYALMLEAGDEPPTELKEYVAEVLTDVTELAKPHKNDAAARALNLIPGHGEWGISEEHHYWRKKVFDSYCNAGYGYTEALSKATEDLEFKDERTLKQSLSPRK